MATVLSASTTVFRAIFKGKEALILEQFSLELMVTAVTGSLFTIRKASDTKIAGSFLLDYSIQDLGRWEIEITTASSVDIVLVNTIKTGVVTDVALICG